MPKGDPAPTTRIETDDYVKVFKTFKEEHYKDGKWTCHGKVFIQPLNAAIIAYQKTVADGDKAELGRLTALTMLEDNRDTYDKKIISKHNQTRAKIRKDLRKKLNIEFNVSPVPKGSPRGTTEDLSGLTDSHREAYMAKSSDNIARVNSAIPSLPSYDGTRKSRTDVVSGEDLLKLLEA